MSYTAEEIFVDHYMNTKIDDINEDDEMSFIDDLEKHEKSIMFSQIQETKRNYDDMFSQIYSENLNGFWFDKNVTKIEKEINDYLEQQVSCLDKKLLN